MYSIKNVIVSSPSEVDVYKHRETRRGDAVAIHYYEPLTYTTAKKWLGVRLVPFLSYGFTVNSCVPMVRGDKQAMKDRSFLDSSFGNTRIIGAVVCPRLMIARKRYGEGAFIVPRTKEGEVFLAGTPKEYWTAVLRGTAMTLEYILKKGWTTVQGYAWMNFYSPERVFMGVLQMIGESNEFHHERLPGYVLYEGNPIDKELLLIANIWMSNYIDWFNREVEHV